MNVGHLKSLLGINDCNDEYTVNVDVHHHIREVFSVEVQERVNILTGKIDKIVVLHA